MEKCGHPPISPLGNMMGNTGSYNAGDTSHVIELSKSHKPCQGLIKVDVPRISSGTYPRHWQRKRE